MLQGLQNHQLLIIIRQLRIGVQVTLIRLVRVLTFTLASDIAIINLFIVCVEELAAAKVVALVEDFLVDFRFQQGLTASDFGISEALREREEFRID